MTGRMFYQFTFLTTHIPDEPFFFVSTLIIGSPISSYSLIFVWMNRNCCSLSGCRVVEIDFLFDFNEYPIDFSILPAVLGQILIPLFIRVLLNE